MFNFLTKSAKFNQKELKADIQLINRKMDKNPSNFISITSQQHDNTSITDEQFISANNVTLQNCNYPLLRNFTPLHQKLSQYLKSQQITKPTLPQSLAFHPITNQQQNLVLISQTGSGKTLSYLIPILNHLLTNPSHTSLTALILVPTKELIQQITSVLPVIKSVKSNSIQISTPQSALSLKLDNLKFLILDECDELLSKQNVKIVDKLLQFVPSEVKISLFSASLSEEIKKLQRTFLGDYAIIYANNTQKPTENVFHQFTNCGKESQKGIAIKQILSENSPPFLIFCKSNQKCRELHQELILNSNFPSLLLIGEMNESERKMNYLKFREGKALVLVVSDVACRGLDFFGINCVIQYDLPGDVVKYIHRSGRSGRQFFGKSVVLYTQKEKERGAVEGIWGCCAGLQRAGYVENVKEKGDEM